jgi:hypothetical protein
MGKVYGGIHIDIPFSHISVALIRVEMMNDVDEALKVLHSQWEYDVDESVLADKDTEIMCTSFNGNAMRATRVPYITLGTSSNIR